MKLFLSMFNIVASYLFQYRRRIFECRTRNFYKSSDGNPATAQAGMSGWCCSTSGSASKHNLDNKCQSFYTGLSSQVRNYTDSKCFEGVVEINIGDLFVTLKDLDGKVLKYSKGMVFFFGQESTHCYFPYFFNPRQIFYPEPLALAF